MAVLVGLELVWVVLGLPHLRNLHDETTKAGGTWHWPERV